MTLLEPEISFRVQVNGEVDSVTLFVTSGREMLLRCCGLLSMKKVGGVNDLFLFGNEE